MLETFDILNHEFYSKFKITIRFQRLRDDFGALRFRSLTLNEPTIWGQIIPGFCFYLLNQKKNSDYSPEILAQLYLFFKLRFSIKGPN